MASVVASQPQNALGHLLQFPQSLMITEMVRREANQQGEKVDLPCTASKFLTTVWTTLTLFPNANQLT